MASLFLDSFSHYAIADLAAKYDGGVSGTASMAIGTTYGRRTGGAGIHFPASATQWIAKGLPNPQSLVFGFAARWSGFPGSNNRFVDANNGNFRVNITNLGIVNIQDGYGNPLINSSVALLLNTWAFIEIRLTANGGNADTILRINGNQVGSSLNNSNYWAPGQSPSLRLGNINGDGSMAFDMTDLYIFDRTGTVYNDFVGDNTVFALLPNAAGTDQALANTGGASQLASVQSNPPDGDTSYISSATVGQRSTFSIPALPAGWVPKVVQVVADVRKDDISTRMVADVVRSGATVSVGPSVAPPTTYTMITRPLDTDPNTAAAWTAAGFNAIEIGAQVTN